MDKKNSAKGVEERLMRRARGGWKIGRSSCEGLSDSSKEESPVGLLI